MKTRLMNILMQLRKCVNHPYLFDGTSFEMQLIKYIVWPTKETEIIFHVSLKLHVYWKQKTTSKILGDLGTVESLVSDHPKCQAYVVAYESLDHMGSKFCLISTWY